MTDPAASLVSTVQARIAAIGQVFSSLGTSLGAAVLSGDFEAVLSSVQALAEPLSSPDASSGSSGFGGSSNSVGGEGNSYGSISADPIAYLPIGELGAVSRGGGSASYASSSPGYGYGIGSAGGEVVQGASAAQLLSMGVPADMVSLFESAAQSYGIPSQLLAAVAKAESGFDPQAVSSAGAEGLMQIMPSTAAGLGIDPFDPVQAVYGAARILAGNIAEFGSIPLAVAAYNAGAGAVQRYGGIPPYRQTEEYVKTVLSYMAQANNSVDSVVTDEALAGQEGAGYVG